MTVIDQNAIHVNRIIFFLIFMNPKLSGCLQIIDIGRNGKKKQVDDNFDSFLYNQLKVLIKSLQTAIFAATLKKLIKGINYE